MAWSLPNGRTQTALADINVTPLVDVVLVLLVIFMITAPVIQSSISVNVPHTRTSRQVSKPGLVVTVAQSGDIYLNDHLVNIHRLPAALKQRLPQSADRTVYVRADEKVSWGALAQVMDEIKRGGLKQVSLVTQPYRHR